MSWKLDGSYAPEKHMNLNADISPRFLDLSEFANNVDLPKQKSDDVNKEV